MVHSASLNGLGLQVMSPLGISMLASKIDKGLRYTVLSSESLLSHK